MTPRNVKYAIESRFGWPAALILAALFVSCSRPAEDSGGQQALVAVAANFFEPMKRLEVAFESASEHDVTVTTGSTGSLFAQILEGAPYDLFFAADRDRPARLDGEGLVVPGSRFTYAVGRLVLWSADPLVSVSGAEALRSESLGRLAIASPDLAPYGAAARRMLERLHLWEGLQGRLATAENVGQAYAFVASGNADAGLLALSTVRTGDVRRDYWLVPEDLHEPIRQDVVLLRRAATNAAALSFLDFVRSRDARQIVENFGYDTE